MKRIIILSLMIIAIAASGAVAKPLFAEFSKTTSGYIYNSLTSTSPTAVAPHMGFWGQNNGVEYRAFLDFDTSSMSTLSFPIVSKVELVYDAGFTAVQYPGPDSFDCNLYVDEFWADGFNGNDWGAGDYAASKSWSGSVNDCTIDLGQAGINMMYYFGPDYIAFDPPENFGVSVRVDGTDDFLSGLERGCKLRVYYSLTGKAMEETSSFGSVKALYR